VKSIKVLLYFLVAGANFLEYRISMVLLMTRFGDFSAEQTILIKEQLDSYPIIPHHISDSFANPIVAHFSVKADHASRCFLVSLPIMPPDALDMHVVLTVLPYIYDFSLSVSLGGGGCRP
jgi:hypothetical protein